VLTKALALYEFGRDGTVTPDRIRQSTHAVYPALGEELLDLFRGGIGQTRGWLAGQVSLIMEADLDCPDRRARAFYKLMEDASTFDASARKDAQKLRAQVMDMAAPYHPLRRTCDGLWGKDEAWVKALIANKLKRPWPDIEAGLFADLQECHPLLSFKGYPDAAALLNRYNVAQAQALLYFCKRLTVEAREDFKRILRYSKLARLMHRITSLGVGHYLFEFTGPASTMRETSRYGPQMAQFLPSLLRCQNWSMKAELVLPHVRGIRRFELSPADRLMPRWPETSEYDSTIESGLALKWGEERQSGWLLRREDEVFWRHQQTFTPDFSLTHEDGRRVFLEIAGFWTPEYIKHKRDILAAFRDERIILAVPSGKKEHYTDLGIRIIPYKTSLSPKAVLEAIA
jgi:predicted nuclease of restriction endonuclease-like RecB superfamily